MNKEAASKWVEALEGGQYRQIARFMHSDDGFCQLGVLCETYRISHGGEWVPARCQCKHLENSFEPHYEFMGARHMPPDEVMRWIDLQCACRRGAPHCCEAAAVLDAVSASKTFAQTASELRALLERVPK